MPERLQGTLGPDCRASHRAPPSLCRGQSGSWQMASKELEPPPGPDAGGAHMGTERPWPNTMCCDNCRHPAQRPTRRCLGDRERSPLISTRRGSLWVSFQTRVRGQLRPTRSPLPPVTAEEPLSERYSWYTHRDICVYADTETCAHKHTRRHTHRCACMHADGHTQMSRHTHVHTNVTDMCTNTHNMHGHPHANADTVTDSETHRCRHTENRCS